MPYSETWAEHYPDGTVIPYMDKKAREAIGEGYNPPYSVGQAIMYEGVTYVANTNIASDEIWTPAHWTASNVCAMYNELKSNLDLLQTRVGNIKSLQLITGTATTGSTGNIATGVTNDGKHLVFGAYASGANVYFNVFVSGINNGFYLKCKDVDTNQFIVNTSIAYRYYLLEMV